MCPLKNRKLFPACEDERHQSCVQYFLPGVLHCSSTGFHNEIADKRQKGTEQENGLSPSFISSVSQQRQSKRAFSEIIAAMSGQVPIQSAAEGVQSGYLQLTVADAVQHFHLI